jgi:uncharacterized membrane protein (DUF373 family)
MNKILYIIATIAIILDFILTRIGINIGIIEEGNLLLIWAFKSDILLVFILAIVLFSLYLLYKQSYKYLVIKIGLIIIILERIYILYLHSRWMFIWFGW